MNRLTLAVVVVLMGCGGAATSSAMPAESGKACLSGLGPLALVQGPRVPDQVPTHVMLEGPGFFTVSDGHSFAFTRRGAFFLNQQGVLVDLHNLKVQGRGEDGSLQQLMVPTMDPPTATHSVYLVGNLDAEEPIKTWDPTDPSATAATPAALTMYGPLGEPFAVTFYFTKTGAGTWQFHAMTDGSRISGGTAGTFEEIASGTLTFDVTGQLQAMTSSSNLLLAGSIEATPVEYTFAVTQYRSASAFTYTEQDGLPAGQVMKTEFDLSRHLTATYSNGATRIIGELAIAQFEHPSELLAVESDLAVTSRTSGALSFDRVYDEVVVPRALERLPNWLDCQ